jgi:hypothetical protein
MKYPAGTPRLRTPILCYSLLAATLSSGNSLNRNVWYGARSKTPAEWSTWHIRTAPRFVMFLCTQVCMKLSKVNSFFIFQTVNSSPGSVQLKEVPDTDGRANCTRIEFPCRISVPASVNVWSDISCTVCTSYGTEVSINLISDSFSGGSLLARCSHIISFQIDFYHSTNYPSQPRTHCSVTTRLYTCWQWEKNSITIFASPAQILQL